MRCLDNGPSWAERAQVLVILRLRADCCALSGPAIEVAVKVGAADWLWCRHVEDDDNIVVGISVGEAVSPPRDWAALHGLMRREGLP